MLIGLFHGTEVKLVCLLPPTRVCCCCIIAPGCLPTLEAGVCDAGAKVEVVGFVLVLLLPITIFFVLFLLLNLPSPLLVIMLLGLLARLVDFSMMLLVDFSTMLLTVFPLELLLLLLLRR